MSTNIKVSERTRDRFAKLAKATGRPIGQLAEDAVDVLERRLFFDQLSAGYAALRADATAWSEIEAERRAETGAPRSCSTSKP